MTRPPMKEHGHLALAVPLVYEPLTNKAVYISLRPAFEHQSCDEPPRTTYFPEVMPQRCYP